MRKINFVLILCALVFVSDIAVWSKEPVPLRAPEILRVEHDELYAVLEKLIKMGGKTGKAASEVKIILRPHLHKEEEYVLPQLGILNGVVTGELKDSFVYAMRLSDKLAEQLPQMLAEHRALNHALDRLVAIAKTENKPEALCFTERLKLHEKDEEQVFYPSAILVGKYLKLRESKKI